MSRRHRDYKAEYARRKAIAQSKGTTPARLRRAVREGTYVPIRPLPKPIIERIRKESPRQQEMRRESAHWASVHSRQPTSAYSPRMTAKQVAAYHEAYVVFHPNQSEKMRYLREYLVGEMDYYTPEEYEDSANYH